MYSAKDIAVWFLFKNNAEVREHEVANDEYEVYEGITHLKLQKLLYYAQGISLALHDKPIFSENILAWTHGPVVKEVYNTYTMFGRNSIVVPSVERYKEILNRIENDKEALEVLNLTYYNFAIYTAWQLRQMTHYDNSPWDITKKTKGLDNIIDQELIKDFF
ncbi:MAG: SocA family protein, partial [Clostridia bacterium]|nr:SocA family protein [Clostridia bacterium]